MHKEDHDAVADDPMAVLSHQLKHWLLKHQLEGSEEGDRY